MASQYLRSRFSSLREYLTPVKHSSTFATTGEVTPEEFVMAGDYLVYRFPTWQWSSAPEGKTRDFLPSDKQFLVTRHVPCYHRVKDYEREAEEEEERDIFINDDDNGTNNDDDEAWTAMGVQAKEKRVDRKMEDNVKEHSDEESTEVNDIDDLIDEDAEDDLDYTSEPVIQDKNKRSYDLYISYSTSYRVPKMYLVGFDVGGSPLTPEEMFEDISSDYRHKTVTIEKAPFLCDTTVVSIHPCKHATVMKVLMKKAASTAGKDRFDAKQEDQMVKDVSKLGLAEKKNGEGEDQEEYKDEDGDEDEWEDLDGVPLGIRVDQYLVVFLKFMSSVTPGIEHDYTMEAL